MLRSPCDRFTHPEACSLHADNVSSCRPLNYVCKLVAHQALAMTIYRRWCRRVYGRRADLSARGLRSAAVQLFSRYCNAIFWIIVKFCMFVRLCLCVRYCQLPQLSFQSWTKQTTPFLPTPTQPFFSLLGLTNSGTKPRPFSPTRPRILWVTTSTDSDG